MHEDFVFDLVDPSSKQNEELGEMKHPSPKAQRDEPHYQEEELSENARLMEEEKKEPMPVQKRYDLQEIAQMEEIK